jgi:hypothetical protein
MVLPTGVEPVACPLGGARQPEAIHNTEKLETFTYAKEDICHVIAPNVEAFRAELARLYQYHPQAPAFICINQEVGVVTHYL